LKIEIILELIMKMCQLILILDFKTYIYEITMAYVQILIYLNNCLAPTNISNSNFMLCMFVKKKKKNFMLCSIG